MRSFLLFPILLLGTSVSAAEPASTLRFAWPKGLKARVEVHIQGEREAGDRTQRHDARATFTLSTQLQGEELQVKREDFSGWKGTLPARMGSPTDRLVDRIPLVRVSRQGEFLGIEGAAKAREAFASEVKLESLDTANRRVFGMVTTDEALRAVALDFWNMSAGAWPRLNLGPGKSRELRSPTAVPQLGGGKLDLVTTFRWVGPAACTPDEKEPRCVELVLKSNPDSEQAKKLLQQALTAQSGNGPVTESFESTQELRAVVEPATLVPHRLTLRRSSQMRLRSPQGKSESGREQTERAYVFHYTSPAAP
ncbi:hypothetical protein CYFUS_000915 [Cystobacter fuscus]|uniref:Lipoprotein n=1 Tax=Cystobacter fuscus TaxID=43 RepID=A0A250IW92_9BACT|nr:hypothetical protein [Cystobacter fuscus]ATB35502.1 hypothetical protein CYFUS_000915 [Cystobacter fuscus]